MKRWPVVFVVAIIFLATAGKQDLFAKEKANINDVVVLLNGDIHAGTVAQETFTIETIYGRVKIPYGLIDKVYFYPGKKKKDQLLTIFGERFTGRILEQELFVLRDVMGPSLPVSAADISRIEFAHRKLQPILTDAPVIAAINNGDHFKAQVLTSDLMVKTESGLKLISSENMKSIEFDSIADLGEVRVQIRFLKSSQVIIGAVLNSTIGLRNQYNQTANIGSNFLESINFTKGDTAKHSNLQIIQDRFDDDSFGPVMAVIPVAPYRRGDLQGNGDQDEKPVHTVKLAKPFALGIHPVTFEEYDRFSEEFGRARPEDEGWGRGRRPVINVSWEDAVSYSKWISRKTGKNYRLPTDGEWEFAARAGSQTRFWWGNAPGQLMANCAQCNSLWDGEKTSPVGKFPPNPFGLYDIAGNVWEWMADCYHDKLSGFPKDGSAVQKKGCGKRVIRGGAWSFPPKEMRSANRWRDFPTRRSDDTGFRLLREIEQ